MRPFALIRFLVIATFARTAFAQDEAAATTSSSTGTSTSSAAGTPDAVAFLQTLQGAQVASMSCLITLVNMTYNPIGSCLGLTTLSELIVAPTDNSSFSGQLDSYLDTVCAGSACTDDSIKEAQAQLAGSCSSSQDTELIKVLQAIFDNYTNSYRTLACAVHFNGTAAACLPATLNSTQEADNNQFFNDLVTGANLEQYQQDVFQQAECTGCMYQLYKASVYMIPSIRGKPVTSAFGEHLQQCGEADQMDWSNVQDQQIPDALQVQQSTGRPTGGAEQRMRMGSARRWLAGVAALGVGMWTLT